MKEISIPLSDFLDKQIAEIEVKINGEKRQSNFKVESFRWEPEDEVCVIEDKIKLLQERIEMYDKSWKPIHIFRPKDDSNNNKLTCNKSSNGEPCKIFKV